MSKPIVMEIGATPRALPQLKRRWVFLRPSPEDAFAGRQAARGR
ncbi:MAG: hypothetical protein V1806_17865 [Pseudomonadota bacterium]